MSTMARQRTIGPFGPNGSVGKSDRQFLWMMDERRFAIQWTRTVDIFVFGEDCTKASIVNEKGVKIYSGERVAP